MSNKQSANPNGAEEGSNVGQVLTRSPIDDFCNSAVVGKSSIESASVAEDGNFSCTYGCLHPGKCSSAIFRSLYNLVEVLKVFPDKSTDSWIFGYGFWLTVFLNIHGSWSFDRNVVDVRLGHMQYFGLQNMGDVVVEYWY